MEKIRNHDNVVFLVYGEKHLGHVDKADYENNFISINCGDYRFTLDAFIKSHYIGHGNFNFCTKLYSAI